MSTQNVLFDAPGPKARRRHLMIAGVGVLGLAYLLWVVIAKLAEANQLEGYMWTPFINDPEVWTEYLLPGLWETIKAAALSVILAGVFGVVFGMGRLSHLKAVRWACGAVVEFFRSVPVLMMILFAYYAGLFSLHITGELLPLFGVVVGLTVYNSCVLAELIRSGVNSLPDGQRESGLAIGLTPFQTLTTIQLPQAVASMLPSMLSQLVVILKDSALGSMVSYLELLRAGSQLASAFSNLIPTMIVLAVIYILINSALTNLAGVVQQRLRRGPRAFATQTVTAGFVPAPAAEPEVSTTILPPPDDRPGRGKKD